MSILLRRSLFVGLVLGLSVPAPAEAIVFDFRFRGQIAGFEVVGSFGYDENQSYTDGIVTEDNLDFLDLSFFGPDGKLLRTYEDNHEADWANFNFDTATQKILQEGSWTDPDGLNIGSLNYHKSGPNEGDVGSAEPLSFSLWSKPPTSGTPHLHVDNWTDDALDANGDPYPTIGFGSHEDVAFPTRTTQQLIDTGKVGADYQAPLGEPVTPLDQTGEYIEVTRVPEPTSAISLLAVGAIATVSAFKKKLVA
ncbi:MAG: hypothetical protein ACFB0C_03045 [Leptolyngbyaceae cyanobacterium]